jgi:hypothetical protein
MRREFDNKVLVDEWGRDPVKPVALLSAGDFESAYVMVGEEKVVLSRIPKEERANIIAARQRRALPITEQTIAETYVRVHGKAPSEARRPAGQGCEVSEERRHGARGYWSVRRRSAIAYGHGSARGQATA